MGDVLTSGARLGHAAVLAAYLLVAAVYTHPLLEARRDRIAGDRYDPVLNASILWWNATTVPLSSAWWTAPHFYPARDTSAFTENLIGLWPISTPLLRATDDPIAAYNLTVYLTWPLSAFAVYLLVLGLGARPGPSFVAGLAFAFAPYRLTQLAHIQVLVCFWLPVALLGLHRYLLDRRPRWLLLFGAAWLLQSLTNGYFLLFGAVLIALWLVYFCSTRTTANAVLPILATWVVSSLPLVPVLLAYARIHDAHGFQRGMGVIRQYSAQPSAWLQVAPLASVWQPVLHAVDGESSLFPGLTVVLLVAVGLLLAAVALVRETRTDPRGPRWLGRTAAAVMIAGLVVMLATLAIGPWRLSLFGLTVRAGSLDRPLLVTTVAGIVLLAVRAREPRSPFIFYCGATLLIALFCMGPEIRSGVHVLLENAPYRWLLLFPGFENLRVPTRFWMIGTLCLSVAAGLALDLMTPARRGLAFALVLISSGGVLADGWTRTLPMGDPPRHWPAVEPQGIDRAILELPLGPEWDAAATFRAVTHRRRVVNGVSGYDPPHYGMLQRALAARDPAALVALASLGPLDVVVDGTADGTGDIEHYVRSMPGVELIADDGARKAFRLRDLSSPAPPRAAAAMAVASARDADGRADLSAALDAEPLTMWRGGRQDAGRWLELDLGEVRTVASVGYGLGGAIESYPRRLAVELSADGRRWTTVWQEAGLAHALAAVMREPREATMGLRFEPSAARFVRLRLAADADALWTIATLRVYGPG